MNKASLPITNQKVVETLIPQKHPFVMVDALFEFSENNLQSGLLVTDENIFVKNHLFQESGIIEHMAQSVALYTGYQYYLKKKKAPTGYIGSIKQAEIVQLPKTGQHITSKVQVLQEFGGVTLVEISTSSNGKAIANAQMKTVIAQ
ncbi:hypothetical protein [Planktosalinus lacus]|uniref:3-hydroxymyristoyl/3-hydroxydecanoyl-(Acyl carrier protein) dehydratase n=1 Tax=Planktosalinus lacus TaxID=1526573 RepID=A0A8J2Y7D7_9FLAO|nr:hypothetical protein [Planktosalinus lacus]GGD80805.1 hypothetical protein GCM10011312_01360 [Planktosalinus lacus]